MDESTLSKRTTSNNGREGGNLHEEELELSFDNSALESSASVVIDERIKENEGVVNGERKKSFNKKKKSTIFNSGIIFVKFFLNFPRNFVWFIKEIYEYTPFYKGSPEYIER
jgi:hypothetical protein